MVYKHFKIDYKDILEYPKKLFYKENLGEKDILYSREEETNNGKSKMGNYRMRRCY